MHASHFKDSHHKWFLFQESNAGAHWHIVSRQVQLEQIAESELGTSTTWALLVHPTKNQPGRAFTLEQRRLSQSLILRECEWKQDSLFRLKVQKCFYHQMRDGQDFGQLCSQGAEQTPERTRCVPEIHCLLHSCLYQQQQCIRAFPDTGQLSDRRLLWSVCQTLIWANIEEHSAIASMIAASSPLWARRHVNKSESTYLEMFSNFAFCFSIFTNRSWDLIKKVNESWIKSIEFMVMQSWGLNEVNTTWTRAPEVF